MSERPLVLIDSHNPVALAEGEEVASNAATEIRDGVSFSDEGTFEKGDPFVSRLLESSSGEEHLFGPAKLVVGFLAELELACGEGGAGCTDLVSERLQSAPGGGLFFTQPFHPGSGLRSREPGQVVRGRRGQFGSRGEKASRISSGMRRGVPRRKSMNAQFVRAIARRVSSRGHSIR